MINYSQGAPASRPGARGLGGRWWLGMFLMIAWAGPGRSEPVDITLIPAPVSGSGGGEALQSNPNPAGGDPSVKLTVPGSWGDLEYYPMILEPPDAYVLAMPDLKTHLEPNRWNFSGMNAGAAVAILRDAGLPDETIDRLAVPPVMNETPEGTVFEPSDELILGLTMDARTKLYGALAKANPTSIYSKPYVIDSKGFFSMSERSGISSGAQNLIDRLTFYQVGSKSFSDIGLVLRNCTGDEERWRVVKTLLREKSLNLRLRLSKSSDIEALADYWSSGGRNKDVIPLLESVVNTEGVERLDVVHLLPPNTRKLIHTYPRPMMSVGQQLPDCFWTAFNFFSYDPSDRHFDSIAFEAQLAGRYERATKPYQFGDLIVIANPADGSALHACNYVAGDIVLTKNGRSFNRPWVFSRLQDVVSGYLKAPKVSVAFFRLKEPPQS
ncbi:MAG: hypothetical protein KDM91_04775 [Verrucomicrobiae bacterium]|nr:hypothetical protein [Verrucomicrobiae bacterium]MCP5539396.1 hypothetical protein [Akkermansiaceae bacterium]MCP5551072.1 hypothetical protein [Akkermansiaceae bacterium]